MKTFNAHGFVMEMIYTLLGRLLFPRQQDWQQRKNAKTLLLTAVVAVVLSLALAEVMRMIYIHER